MSRPIIPVFYACDDRFVKYTVVSLSSMIQNASPDYRYHVHVLHTEIGEEMRRVLGALANDRFSIFFDDVSEYLESIANQLPIRDYYSKTTYYRLFIAEMFPEYQKAIYLDSDTVVMGDISRLYQTDLGDAYVGACHEQAMVQVEEFGTYAERVVGVSRHSFFNAGVLLINCEQFRANCVKDRFIRYLHVYTFVVTQDEDYLNLICKDRVHWLDQRWNTEIFGELLHPVEESCILHYIMTNRPWHYADCRHGDVFWRYAKHTAVYGALCRELEGYSEEDRLRDRASADRLIALAVEETNREDNFLNRVNACRSKDRVEILERIEEYERCGRFDEDVEEDPPSRELKPEEVDYFRRGIWARIKTRIAFGRARRFVYRLLREQKLIVKEIRGLEHFQSLKSGAIITCNHFNAFDSFAVQLVYEASKQKKKKRGFYRVIREGNYTSFPGFYGFLMRNCNTLPLSSNRRTLKKFTEATGTLLREGNFVLVYPEQSMWWNYRKPKPLKSGAYLFAAKNNVPVLPMFITMRDTDIVGEDGFYVQEYTVHVSKPIYPDPDCTCHENMRSMMEQNAICWKEIYEREYGIPLEYVTEAQ